MAMPLSMQFGAGPAVSLAGAGDLEKKLASDVPLLFQLSGALAQAAGEKLRDTPDAALQSSFQTAREARWKLDDANISLSFQPSATGSIRIFKSGELFRYNQGGDAGGEVSIPVPAGKAYVGIVLRVALAVEGGAAYSGGSWGVKGNISRSDEFEIANYKLFDSTERCGAALTAAFAGFALPFHAAGIESLRPGDYLDFEFLGKLNLGFGVTYGFAGVKLAGRSGGEVAASFGNNALGRAVLGARPSFQAGAGFALSYDHEDTFRVVAGRTARGASLSLFRAAERGLSTTFNAGVTVGVNANPDLQAHIDRALEKAADTLTAKLPPEAAAVASAALAQSLQRAAGLAGGVTGRVTALLKKGKEQKLELQIEQEKTRRDTALFRFEFDFHQRGALEEGFAAAMQGRYADAIRAPGVTLAPDSFVESLFTARTALTFEFFDLWKFTDATAYTRQVETIYAGNGVFRLRARTGLATDIGAVGHAGHCEVYFTAEARESGAAGTLADLAVKLNFALIDSGNPKAAAQTLRALDRLGSPALQATLDTLRHALTPKSVLRVACVFPQACYQRFHFNPPGTRPAPDDRRNYETFAAAVRTLDPDAPALFGGYDGWSAYQVACCDEDGSAKPPDRTERGGPGWPGAFPDADNLERVRAGCYFDAGRRFMNLCAGLRQLSADAGAAATEAQYHRLLEELNGLIRQDVPVFFLKAALIALIEVSNSVPRHVRLADTELTFECAC